MSEPSQLPSFKKQLQIVNLLVISANGLGAFLTFVFLSYIAPLPQGESAVDVGTIRDFIPTQAATGGSQLQCGIAVATGPVVAGNVRGKERIVYTVIGDTVNLAARLQAMSKELHHDILLNREAYLQACGEMQLHAEEISNVTVRDKNEPVTIYAL